MVLDAGSKLIGHLRGHKGVGDLLLFYIVVQCHQVQAQFLWDDIYTGTTCKSRIHVVHTGVETVTGIGSHLIRRLEVVVAMIPVEKCYQVGVYELASLRHTRRTTRIKHDVKRRGLYFGQCHVECRQLLQFFRQQYVALILIHDVSEFFVGNEQFGTGILHHEVQTLLRISGIQRLIGTTGLHDTDGGNGHPLTSWNQYRYDILRSQSFLRNTASNTVAEFVDFLVSIAVLLIHHCDIVRCSLRLTSEQRDDGLCVVVIHIFLVERVQQVDLGLRGDADVAEQGLRQETIHHGLITLQELADEGLAVFIAVVFGFHLIFAVQDKCLDV